MLAGRRQVAVGERAVVVDRIAAAAVVETGADDHHLAVVADEAGEELLAGGAILGALPLHPAGDAAVLHREDPVGDFEGRQLLAQRPAFVESLPRPVGRRDARQGGRRRLAGGGGVGRRPAERQAAGTRAFLTVGREFAVHDLAAVVDAIGLAAGVVDAEADDGHAAVIRHRAAVGVRADGAVLAVPAEHAGNAPLLDREDAALVGESRNLRARYRA